MGTVNLIDVLDAIARRTWFYLTEARRLGMTMGEVTLTDVNLLELKQQRELHGFPIRIIPTNANESQTGIDFEIWIRGASTNLAYGYAFQAKVGRVVNGNMTYSALNHKVGKLYQYDILIAHTQKEPGLVPMHLFYNGWSPTEQAALLLPSVPPLDAELFGCAALSTYKVRRERLDSPPRGNSARGTLLAKNYLQSSMPWSQLFAPLLPPAGPPTPPPGGAGPAPAGGGNPQAPTGPAAGGSAPGGSGARAGGAGGSSGGQGGGVSTAGPSSSRASDGASDGNSAASTPAAPPQTLRLDQASLVALEAQAEAMAGEDADRHRSTYTRATSLPDYLTRAIAADRAVDEGEDIPRFVILIDA